MRTMNGQATLTNLCLFLLALGSAPARAQFTVGGQVLQRSEFRNGYGRLIDDTTQTPAFFIGHRARIHALYQHEKVRFHVSVQDVRPWGSTEQGKAADDFLSVHEAWGELIFNQQWNLKLGRQELAYDGNRFLGGADWALPGRAHDFALLRYEKGKTKLHAGGGYNVAAESLTDQPYTVPKQYKTAQMLRLEQQWGAFTVSAFLWNNGLEQQQLDSLGEVTKRTMRYSQTIGLPTIKYERKRFMANAYGYFQVGQDRSGNDMQAYDASAWVTYTVPMDTTKGSAFRMTLGAEVLSGTAQDATDKVNRSYAPLYGTAHAFNGYMDHFYVDGRWGNSVGLTDIFLRLRYDIDKRTLLSMNLHEFQAAADVIKNGERLDPRLGNEVDLSVVHLLNDVVALQFGYSQLFATGTLEHMEGVTDPAALQNWAYAAVYYRPGMKSRYAGLVF